MSLRSAAIKGARWSALESLAGQVISFLLFLVLARLLTPVDFGLVAVAKLCVLVIQSLIYQGLGQAIVQFADLDEQHLDTAFYIHLVAGFFFFGLTVVTAPLIGEWFHTPGLAGVLCWLSPVFLVSGLTDVQNNLLVGSMNFRALGPRTLLINLLCQQACSESVLCFAQRLVPLEQRLFLLGQRLFLLGQRHFLLGQRHFLLGQRLFPLGQRLFPLGQRLFPLGQRPFPLGQRLFPLGQRHFLLGQRHFLLGQRHFPLGQRLFPLGQRLFYAESLSF